MVWCRINNIVNNKIHDFPFNNGKSFTFCLPISVLKSSYLQHSLFIAEPKTLNKIRKDTSGNFDDNMRETIVSTFSSLAEILLLRSVILFKLSFLSITSGENSTYAGSTISKGQRKVDQNTNMPKIW